MSIFDSIPKPKVPRSRKKMPHYNLFSTDYGRIVPFEFIECVPRDKFNLRSEVYVNTAPMITAPYMENDIRCDYFFVPYRILWNEWEDFITGGPDGMSDIEKLVINPMNIFQNNPDFFQRGSLWDHFGVPTPDIVGEESMYTDIKIDALPFLAYAKIWQEYYRDQNWQADLTDYLNTAKTSDGDISTLIQNLLETIHGSVEKAKKNKYLANRGWRKDYFTAALPTPQRGPEVPINFDADFTIPVEFADDLANLRTSLSSGSGVPSGISIDIGTNKGSYLVIDESGHLKMVDNKDAIASSGAAPFSYVRTSINDVKGYAAPLGEWLEDLIENQTRDENGFAYVNGQDLPAITINDLRRANAIQVFLERNMRAGYRYVEQILSHFGVRVPDYRLDRPEYIGGFSQPLSVNQIMQNSQTTFGEGGSALGSYAGKGRSASGGKALKYRVEEHGCIIGLMTIMPKAVYTGGVPRLFTRQSRYDYYFPEFANLGEQEVKSTELFLCGDSGDLIETTFGYVPRYSEYQWIPNQVHGDFLKSGMRHFTQFRQFQENTPPSNGDEFISVRPDSDGINRIWAVEDDQDYDHFWVTVFNHVNAKRPMPRWGTPKLKA